MSTARPNITPIAATFLGNHTAKSVLLVLDKHADLTGWCWPRMRLISQYSEVPLRTVQRVIQVFERIGLVTRLRGPNREGVLVDGFQVDMELAGCDLHVAFNEEYRRLHRGVKVRGTSVETENGCVVATRPSVVATRPSVVATHPPHPHIGKNSIELQMNLYPPTPRKRGKAEGAVAHSQPSGRELAVARAVEQVANALGVLPSDKRLLRVMAETVGLAIDKGEEAPTVALAMIAAVKEQAREFAAGRLRFQFGLRRFFREGIWRDKNRWMWNHEECERQASARAGSWG